MPRPAWTARCKSGYVFGKDKPCRRFCSRGELLCNDCASATVVHPPKRESLVRAFFAALRPAHV